MDGTKLVVSALCLVLFVTGGSAAGAQPLRILLTHTVPATSAKTPTPTLYGAGPTSATPLSSPSPIALTYGSTPYPAAGPAYFGSPDPETSVFNLAPISSAATLPAVLASQMLPAYTIASFNVSVQSQFRAALTQNIEAMTGSPVLVWITQLRSGSVDVGTKVVFLDGSAASAANYQAVMISGYTAKIFGSSFGVVVVDPDSVLTSAVSNPSLPAPPLPQDDGTSQTPSPDMPDNQSSSVDTPAPAPSSGLESGSPSPQNSGDSSPSPSSGVLDDPSSSSVGAPVSTPSSTPGSSSPAETNSSVPALSPNATSTPAAASPPPPSPSPPPPVVVLAPITTAAVVPAVTASQTLSAYTVDTFTPALQSQFITTLTNNIEALSGSPVQVTINSISAGSVKVASTVAFLNGDASSASTYQAALTSGDSAKVFGTSFGSVAVDASSVKAVTVSNPKSAAASLGVSVAAATAGAVVLMMVVLA